MNLKSRMKVKVSTLTGKTQWEFELGAAATVEDLKAALSGKEGIEPEKQHMLYNGQKMTNTGKALSD